MWYSAWEAGLLWRHTCQACRCSPSNTPNLERCGDEEVWISMCVDKNELRLLGVKSLASNVRV